MTKIMLVEDDNNLREIYEARLSAEGFEIVAASDGEAALALAGHEHPDLIISDIMMPKISGFELLDIIRNTDGLKNIKVIMLTALGQTEDSARASSMGADRYLVKSQVTLEDIVKAAHDLLEDKPLPAAAPEAEPSQPGDNSPPPLPIIPPEPPTAADPVDPALPATDAAEPADASVAAGHIPVTSPPDDSTDEPTPVAADPPADPVADPAADQPDLADTAPDEPVPNLELPAPVTDGSVDTSESTGAFEDAFEPITESGAVEAALAVAAPPPADAPAEPDVDVTESVDGVNAAAPQNIADEEAAIQAQINDFIKTTEEKATTGAPSESATTEPAPPADAPAEPTPPETPAVEPTVPVATPEPVPVPSEPADKPTAADDTLKDDKLMTTAIDGLVAETSPAEKPAPLSEPTVPAPAANESPSGEASAPAAPTTPEPAPNPNATDTASAEQVTVAKKKIIAPLDTPAKPTIHQLLDMEEARSAAQQAGAAKTNPAQPVAEPPSGSPAPPPAPSAPPGSTPPGSTPFDPSSLAL